MDEWGVVQGLVTPRDLLEAITGELQPHEKVDAWATLREDGSWLIDGLMPRGELKVRLELTVSRKKTVAVTTRWRVYGCRSAGTCPQLANTSEGAGWLFEVVTMDGKRIDKVLANRIEG